MLKLIATQAPDPSGVADNSITSGSSDNAASPVQAAFAQLLAEISSPEVLTITVQPNQPNVPVAGTNIPSDENVPVAPSMSSPTPDVGAGLRDAPRISYGTEIRGASFKQAPTTDSKTANDVQTVPMASLMLLVQHSFQVAPGPDVTRPAAKTQTNNIESVGKSLPSEAALANSIHVEVESAAAPSVPVASSRDVEATRAVTATAPVSPAATVVPKGTIALNGTGVPAVAPRPVAITTIQPADVQLSAPAPLASMLSQQSPVQGIPAAEPPVETTSNLTPVRQDAQALTGVTTDVLTKVAASGQKQAWQESSGDDPKRNSDSSDKTTLSWNPSVAGTTSKFDNHLAAVEAPRPATPVREMPQMPTPISAHKVSIDIGDKESKVIVTLHERAGDVSVKVHAANDTLKTQLQSSVGSLVESLNRANVSLKNVDFSSSYGTTTPDPDQRNAPPYEHLAPRAKRSNTRPECATDDSVRLTSV